jgi:hypothetical protein
VKINAKEASKWTIIFASVWVAVLLLGKAVLPAVFGKDLGLSLVDILSSGGFFVIIWSPVYRSLWLDKQFGVKYSAGIGFKDGEG